MTTARMTLTAINLDDIHADPDNIRDAAQDADISSLAADIAEHGLLQPLIVYPHPDRPGQYMISGGHRRYYALRRIGLTSTDANVVEPPAGDLNRIDLMFSENEHRRSLNPIELAKVYKRYADAGLTQAEISLRVKRAQPIVSQYMLLLTLPDHVQRKLVAGDISVAHASKVVREQRISRGIARGDAGHPTGPRTITVPHFDATHPLYEVASRQCRRANHDASKRIGGACGECWEHKIRQDAARSSTGEPAATPQPQLTVEAFTDPRELLRHVNCTRCGINALDRPNETRCASRRGGRLQLFEHHEFPLHIAAPAERATA